ncbi:hypothetical protein [Sulfurospirillum arcachonense]|uniref:hypothetical protein n=1 Tax=Sulfurospirillum arcachonense TaxID=57666 RepID=UPI00046941DA|nr:hypothetical protein [Sulfurospirillum arcachonense]
MKDVVNYFSKKGVLFKDLNIIDKALLKTRKKIKIFCATDIKKNYHVIFIVNQKSRFLLKNAEDLGLLVENLQQLENHNFRYKHLVISGDMCSKAQNYLKDRGWQLHHDFM